MFRQLDYPFQFARRTVGLDGDARNSFAPSFGKIHIAFISIERDSVRRIHWLSEPQGSFASARRNFIYVSVYLVRKIATIGNVQVPVAIECRIVRAHKRASTWTRGIA